MEVNKVQTTELEGTCTRQLGIHPVKEKLLSIRVPQRERKKTEGTR